MKKYICGLLTCFVFIAGLSQNYYLSSPQGYGANATGGGNATPVTVTTYAAFKTALTSTSPANAVILVSGTIDCVYTSVTLNNKTIIGLPGAKLRNLQITIGDSTASANNSGILYIKAGSKNVIIRNLIFEGPGAYDVDGRDNLTNEGTDIWIDHCEFQDGMDGNFDNKGQADNVSISWCKFTYLKPAIPGGSGGSADHRFSNLIGSSSTDAPTDGHYSITFQNNYWGEGVKGRMPRARNAELHILSCFYNTSVAGATGIGLGGGINNSSCYVENTDFKKVATVYTPAPTDGGTVAINYVNSIRNPSNIGTVSVPTYTTTPIPVEKVEQFLTDATCGAGATLQVSNIGVISSGNCSNLSIINTTNTAKQNITCTQTNNRLQIKFAEQVTGKTKMEIFSMTGQSLITKQENLKSTSQTSIDTTSLTAGLYFLITNLEKVSFNCKFLTH